MASNIYREFDKENPVNSSAIQQSQINTSQYKIPDSVVLKSLFSYIL